MAEIVVEVESMWPSSNSEGNSKGSLFFFKVIEPITRSNLNVRTS